MAAHIELPNGSESVKDMNARDSGYCQKYFNACTKSCPSLSRSKSRQCALVFFIDY